MQDMRIFNCGIDRRLRTNNAINQQQTLKCPRCESVNTKFCYYNNYNLSQPRYYCKACRRYWTKGGVLRNVPVGGGIRKAKRSSKAKKSLSSADPDADDTKSESNSSSERSSLTAATTTATTSTTPTATPTEVVSGGNSLNSCPNLFNFGTDSPFIVPQINELTFNHQNLIDPDNSGSMFPEIARFTDTDLGFNIADTSNFRSENLNDDQMQQMQNNTRGGYLDQTTDQIDFKDTEIKINDEGLTGMFDLTGNVDEAYWSQTQWPDHSDHSFHFHLP